MRPIRPLALSVVFLLFVMGCSKSAHLTRPEAASRSASQAGLVAEDPLAGGGEDAGARPDAGANVPPTVQIESPRPNALVTPSVAPGLQVRISGTDPDGHPDRPVEYRWLLLQGTSFDADYEITTYLIEPDSLRRKYTPGFEGWNALRGNETEFELPGLVPNVRALLTIVAIDRDGAYTPTFSQSTNMLYFRVVHPDFPGPRIGITGPVSYLQPVGRLEPGPEVTFNVVAPQVIPIEWYTRDLLGATSEFRYGIDLTDDALGWDVTGHGWSAWSRNVTSTTFEVAGVDPVVVTIQARDSYGLRSMLQAAFRPTQAVSATRAAVR